MAWTTPPTLTDGQVLTGAHTQIWRDDINLTPAGLASAQGQLFVADGTNSIAARMPVASSVATVEATTSTVYTNLTTFGPQAILASTGTFALVGISSKMTQNTNGANALAAFGCIGATTIAQSDLVAINRQFAAAGTDTIRMSAVTMQTGLTPGANTFVMQYRVTAGSSNFDARHIWAIPF